MRRHIWAGIGLFHAASAVAEYVWPSKYDRIEDLMMLQSGYIRLGFFDAVSPCAFGTLVEGRQNAAEWIRTAYHDMSTHDVSAGTGGLDASIMFELDRAENIGTAFDNTMGFMNNFYSVKSNMADMIALGVVVASDMCGGPKIPYRAGRVDATEAGPKGVPEPSQDLATHTNIFAKAGFNTSDMITMVACGHTVGGVHNANFPEITGDTTADVVHPFEGGDSNFRFDNMVVTEYLNGSAPNLLVVGSNDTTNSDKRIFEADGNVTMNALANPDVFQAKCADILERMINTVPSTVTLSDVIEPIEVKPYIKVMALNSDGMIYLEGRIRVRITGKESEELEVHLSYADRNGVNSSAVIETTRPSYKGGSTSGVFGEEFGWYEFSTALDAAAGISKFNVHIKTSSTGEVKVIDNAGNGFPLDDSVLYQQSQSCFLDTSSTEMRDITLSAAVRKSRADESLVLDMAHLIEREGVITPMLEVKQTAFKKTGTEKGDYVMFEARTSIEVTSQKITFDVVLGDGETQSKVEFQDTGVLTDVCTSLG